MMKFQNNLSYKQMINYNNNNLQERIQATQQKPTSKQTQPQSFIFQAISLEQSPKQYNQQQEEKISTWQTPKPIKKEREWQDVDGSDKQKQKALTGTKQVQKVQPKKIVPYQKNIKKEGQVSQDRLKSKLNFIINAAVQGNEDITVSNCSRESIRQSNNSSETQSIHSNDRNWRKQFYKEKEPKQVVDKRKVHNQKIEKKEKRTFFHDEEQIGKGKNSFKYLFYEQNSQNSEVEEKMHKTKQELQIKNVKSQIKVVDKQSKQIKQLKQENSTENKIKYTYQKGKHLEGETKQERTRNKLGFLLDCLQESSQVVSVSYDSQKNSIQSRPFIAAVQKQKQKKKEVQQHHVQNVEEVIFAQNKEQHQEQEVKQKSQNQHLVVERLIFEELEAKPQVEEDKNQIAAVTPKQTIDLDKSFKSKISNKTPNKSKALSQSLDKSSKSRIIHKTPSTAKQRKNSLEQLNRIIADIQKKSSQYKSAVDNSIRSQRKSQADQQSEPVQNHKKYSVRSARKISVEEGNQIFSKESNHQEQKQTHNQAKDHLAENKSKRSVVSQFQAEIEQIQLKQAPKVSILIQNQRSSQQLQENSATTRQFQKLSQPKSVEILSNLQSVKQSGSIASKQQSKKDSSEYSQRNIKEQGLNNIKKKSIQEFQEETEAVKDKSKVKQTKQIKHSKNGYLKTQMKEDADDSDLITELLPKNKIQFKIDINRRLKTQTSSLAIDNKKLQVLLKRRQEALVKKTKEQSKIDPRSFIFPQSSSAVSKQSSMNSNQQTFSDAKLHYLTARNIIGESRTRLMTNIGFKRDSSNVQKPYLPALTSRTEQLRDEEKVYITSNSIRKEIHDSLAQNRSKGDSLFQKRFNQQAQKALQQQPVVKIEFHGLSKNKNSQHSQRKYLDAKEKYQRLKKLLESN